jgi:hypothetical protein
LTGRISNKGPGTRELLARLRSVLLYLLSDDNDKADRIEAPLAARGVISVQVLNEFSAVALRKLQLLLNDIREILDTIRAVYLGAYFGRQDPLLRRTAARADH